MNIDHSWNECVKEYIDMYNLIISKNMKAKKNNVISIILGQGSRLHPFTLLRLV
jgi:hypothetical protein